MKVCIEKSKLKGRIIVPPSKSMAHRMLICAGLAEGKSIVHNIAFSEDILATLDCLCALGAEYKIEGNTIIFEKSCGEKMNGKLKLCCRESGSTLRFFIPICSVTGMETNLTGSEKLLSRPLSVYEEIFERQKIKFDNNGKEIFLQGRIAAGRYEIRGDISSQFISGLLFALPLLEKDSEICLIPPVESRSYIDLTLAALKEFGVEVVWKDETTLFVRGGQNYTGRETTVEGDYSNAAFFDALACLGNEIEVKGLDEESLQGDRIYREYFPLLEKEGQVLDLGDCPDLGPVLFAVAAAKKGGTFTGTRRLKIKESDRAVAMKEELSKFGVVVTVKEDSVKIDPVEFHRPTEVLSGHNDHRIVMALAVILTLTGGEIEGAGAVRKSMPDFFDKIKELGAEVRLYD